MSRTFSFASSSYLNVNSTPITGPPFTISAWVRITVDPNTNDYCFFQLQDNGSNTNLFRLNADGGASGEFSFKVYDSSASGHSVSSVIPDQNVWYNVVVVARATNDREIYVNGASEGANTTTVAPSGINSVSIGREMDSSPADSWDGDIAGVGFWNIGLTDLEIASLSLYSPELVRPQNLAAYWDLINSDTDPVGGYHMTASNVTTSEEQPPIIYPMPQQVWASAAIPSITGILDVTLGDVITASTGELDIAGELSETLADVASASTGELDIAGELTQTLDSATLSSTGEIDIAGELTQTLGDVVSTSVGEIDIAGELTQTLADATLASTGVILSDIEGTLSVTLADVTLSSASELDIAGELTQTLATLTLSSTGVVGVAAGMVEMTFTSKQPEMAFASKQPEMAFTSKQPEMTFTS